jgi:hypothetical protein
MPLWASVKPVTSTVAVVPVAETVADPLSGRARSTPMPSETGVLVALP